MQIHKLFDYHECYNFEDSYSIYSSQGRQKSRRPNQNFENYDKKTSHRYRREKSALYQRFHLILKIVNGPVPSHFAESNFGGSHFAESYFAESHFDESHFAESHFAKSHFVESHFADFRLAESNFGGSHFAESHFAETHFRRISFR